MSPRGLIQSLILAGIVVLAASLAFAACGDDDDEEDGGTSPAATEEAGGEIDISDVPELEDGTLTIGSDIAYAPIEFYEEGTENEMGLDVDLARALGDLLGVEVEFQQVADFGGIVGDLTVKRYDVVMSAISITEEREAEIDFVQYTGQLGTGVLVAAGNPEAIESIEDLCGKAVSVQSGTFQVEQVEEGINQNECVDNPIDLRQFPDNPTAVEELSLGRVAAHLSDDPVAAYTALQSDGEVEVAVTGFEAAPYGIGVRKDSAELKAVLEEALQSIMDSGDYDAIFEEWGLSDFTLR